MKQSTLKIRYLVNFLALVILFAAAIAIGMTGGSTMKLKITPSIWQCSYLIIMAASLNLVLGFLGQLSLGHCGFMAVGAYTAALISLPSSGLVFTRKSPAEFSCWYWSSASWPLVSPPLCWACWWVSRLCG